MAIFEDDINEYEIDYIMQRGLMPKEVPQKKHGVVSLNNYADIKQDDGMNKEHNEEKEANAK
jgi:hypothetical protein